MEDEKDREIYQVNVKFQKDLFHQVEAAAKASGQDRSNWIRSILAAAINGKKLPIYSASPSSGPVIDEGARDALLALKDRIDTLEGDSQINYEKLMLLIANLEEQLTEIKQAPKPAVNDNFSDAFLKS